MKKYLLLVVLAVFSKSLYSQSLRTVFNDRIEIKQYYSVQHTFALGDSVNIHAYKKKGDKYHFLIETDDYANVIICNKIPFDVTEKQLKKLPNTLGSDIPELNQQLKKNVDGRLRQQCKQKALSGKIWATVNSAWAFSGAASGMPKIERNDVVYIIGYKKGYSENEYALYGNNIAGVYKASGTSGLFDKKIDMTYMPSIDDEDVQKLLMEKQNAIAEHKAEEKRQYRKKALGGEIPGIISYGNLKTVGGEASPFHSGDTVAVVGYSKIGTTHYFALYSNEAVANVSSSSSLNSVFRNSEYIKFDNLPAYDDPEVVLKMNQEEAYVDSVMSIKLAESRKRLAESQDKLIQTYKEYDPVIVKLDSWDSNSAGGIEVSLSVINCSSQTIKYITIQGYFTNAVGDKCRNEIGGGTIWKGKGIGPIGPRPTTLDNFYERIDECKGSYTFDNLTFYSRVAQYFHFSSVTIQYMNGKTITLSGNNLKKHVRY